MWYAHIKDEYVEVYENGNKHIYQVKKCRSMCKKQEIFCFLTDLSIYMYKNKKLIFKVNSIEEHCDKITVNKNIYVSGNDSGTMYKYNLNGEILESIKIGEHISDFCLSNDYLYILSYFNNKLSALKDFNISKEIFFSVTPQSIIVNKFIYVLLNDAYYSYIYMYSLDFNIIKKFKTSRQIGNIYCFNNKILFEGNEYRFVFNENLNIQSIKKSTDIKLCRFSDYPICNNNHFLDICNNIIYPL